MELKTILAQDDIEISQKTIENVFKFPHFNEKHTLMAATGEIRYPEPGAGLMNNPFPKEKTKGKKGRGGSKK